MTDLPKLSLVIVCRSPGSADSMATIAAQRWVEPELIAVNAGPDEPAERWAGDHRKRVTAFVSEPYGHFFPAANAGIAAARGEWILVLGSEDRLVGELVLSETLNWAAKTEAGVVAGEVAFDNGRIERLRSRVNPLAGNFLCHQAALYRRSLFAENGSFDPSLQLMADYDFNVRLWKNRVRFKPIPLRIAAAGVRRLRATASWRGCREEQIVRHRYFGAGRCLPWDIRSLLRFGLRRAARPFSRPSSD